MNFSVTISNIQHIRELKFSIDLSKNGLTCIVGKNSAGKTTLVRALRNLKYADTFKRTAGPAIFRPESHIKYEIDNETYDFPYNPKLHSIDSKQPIDENLKKSIYVELPIPFGERFKFHTRSNIDDDLRRAITLKQYSIPTELIDLLTNIYRSSRFKTLKSIKIKKEVYYFLLLENGFYIREDHFSTGEYFVLQLYRMLQNQCKLIVIDEIDISLDASAQAKLVEELRTLCQLMESNIVFTTHSLALMKTLQLDELYYLDNDNTHSSVINVSYNYIKSILFGFQGYDRYILTEDAVLKSYIDHILSTQGNFRPCNFIVIYIGGGTNTVSLMTRNDTANFLTESQNVLSILDGDQQGLSYCESNSRVVFLPFRNIEHEVDNQYQRTHLFPDIGNYNGNKDLFYKLKNKGRMTQEKIFQTINQANATKVKEFTDRLISFLNDGHSTL